MFPLNSCCPLLLYKTTTHYPLPIISYIQSPHLLALPHTVHTLNTHYDCLYWTASFARTLFLSPSLTITITYPPTTRYHIRPLFITITHMFIINHLHRTDRYGKGTKLTFGDCPVLHFLKLLRQLMTVQCLT